MTYLRGQYGKATVVVRFQRVAHCVPVHRNDAAMGFLDFLAVTAGATPGST